MAFSVAMIVRNEAQRIESCIKSLQRFDPLEIVIMDTGSTDDTIKKAESLGARVVTSNNLDDFFVETEYGPQLNFSKARNYVIGQCTSPWILVIDADEQLASDTPIIPGALNKFLARLEENPEITAIAFRHIDFGNDAEVARQLVPRMFKNGAVKYDGTIHEQAHWSKTCGYISFVYIRHFTGILTDEQKTTKFKRNAGLLRQRLKDNAEDLQALYFLHDTLFLLGGETDFQEALDKGLEYIETAEDQDDFFASVYFSTARLLTHFRKFEDAVNLIRRGFNRTPVNMDLSFVLLMIGIETKTPDLIYAGAKGYVDAYQTIDQWFPKAGGLTVSSYNIQNYATALFHVAAATHHASRNYITMLTGVLPKLDQKLSIEIRNGIQMLTGGQPEQPRIVVPETHLKKGLIL